MYRSNGMKLFLWIMVGLATAVAFSKFIIPMAPSPHFLDTSPWRLWLDAIVITAGILSVVILAVFPFRNKADSRPASGEGAGVGDHQLPKFDRSSEVWLGPPRIAAKTTYSLTFVISFAVGFAFLPNHFLSAGSSSTPVAKARGGDILTINGNRNSYGVTFSHDSHIEETGGKESCQTCHHMNLPADRQSGCFECHTSMYEPGDAFRHDWHASKTGANQSCNECHLTGQERTAITAKGCAECHQDLVPDGASIKVDQYQASPYVSAMHGVCVDCHREYDSELASCDTCHGEMPPQNLRDRISGNIN